HPVEEGVTQPPEAGLGLLEVGGRGLPLAQAAGQHAVAHPHQPGAADELEESQDRRKRRQQGREAHDGEGAPEQDADLDAQDRGDGWPTRADGRPRDQQDVRSGRRRARDVQDQECAPLRGAHSVTPRRASASCIWNSRAVSTAEGAPACGSAPAVTRVSTTSSYFLNTAPASGVCPRLFCLSTSAPRSTSACTMPLWPA